MSQLSNTPPPGAAILPVHKPPEYGAKILVIGGTGNGKTHALRTFRQMGIKVFVIFTEPGMRSLADTDPEWVDWRYIPPMKPNLQAAINMAKQINVLDRKQLANYQDPFRAQHNQYIEVLNTLANLRGDRTGKSYGMADKLGQGWALAIDSLSGIGIMAMGLVGGEKPVFDQGEWGIAMGRVLSQIQLLCFSIPSFLVVNAHEEREEDAITGGTKIMVSAPGKKLAPKVPLYFDDVFYAFRKDRNWLWSTNYPGVADLKSRHLGIFDAMPQDYGPVVTAWKKANESAQQL
jgi:hypothetical protein